MRSSYKVSGARNYFTEPMPGVTRVPSIGTTCRGPKRVLEWPALLMVCCLG